MPSHTSSDRDRSGAVIVKVEEMNRDGQCVHEGDFTGEFPDRHAAAAAIKLHLQQFASSGHDETGDFWWGRAANGCETRFFIR